MFDKIPMNSFAGNFDASIKNDPKYRDFMISSQLPESDNLDFSIDGSSSYLLSHPLTKDAKDALMYIQSFSYMNNGSAYYTKRANYPSYLILFTYSGRGILQYEGSTYTLNKGDGFLIDCMKYHSYSTASDTWEHSDLHFYGGNSSFLYEKLFSDKQPVFHIPTIGIYQNVLEELLYEHTRPTTQRDCIVSGILNQILNTVFHHTAEPSTKKKSAEISKLQLYLEAHFTEDVSLDEMIKIANLSKYHLVREFKETVGFTPHQYLIHLRLLQTQQLLLLSDIPSYKIGTIMGFSTEADFINAFKKVFGCTPNSYRSSNKV